MIKKFKFFLLTVSSCVILSSCFNHTQNTIQNSNAVIDKETFLFLNEKHFYWHLQAQGGTLQTCPNVSKYVTKVGMRLAKISEYPHLPYEFVIVNDSYPFYLVFLSGKVAINKGLLVHLQSEAQLAAVLAQAINRSYILYKNRYINHSGAIRTSIKELRQAFLEDPSYKNLSLDQYLEIDKNALITLVRAGYDPKALLELHSIYTNLLDTYPTFKGLTLNPYAKERQTEIKTLLKNYSETGYIGKSTFEENVKSLHKLQNSSRLFESANIALSENEGKQALEIANAALNINPYEPHLHILKGKALVQCRQFKQAHREFNRSLQLYPNYYLNYYERGRLYLIQEMYEKAVYDFEKSLELFPHPGSYYYLGKCHERLGNLQTAIKYFEQIEHAYSNYGLRAKNKLAKLRPTKSTN